MKRINNQFLFLFISIFFFFALESYGQITPQITARIDTTEVNTQKIYTLFCNYINSKPDSLYINPYWDKNEAEILVKKEMNCNRENWFMFKGFENASMFYSIYPPKILSIVQVDSNRYSLKILYNNTTKGYEEFNPTYITKLYAVKDKNEKFYLENRLNYDTRNWKKFNYKFIHYVISPNVTFDQREAKKAIKFCQSILNKFGLQEPSPFTFYITSNSDEMGELFNYDYWLSYSTGITNAPSREIFSSFGKAYYPHEFVHMLLYPLTKKIGGTMLIGEGCATWLAGPNQNTTFQEALNNFSIEIKNNDTITLDDIIENKYRHSFDNTPLYVAGAVICELVYKKIGIKEVKNILNLDINDLKEELQSIFNKSSWNEVDKKIIDYIKNYTPDN